MNAQPATDSVSESDRLDVAADQAIALCNGDPRSAVRSLILANEFLEAEIAELCVAVSKGFARGRRPYRDIAKGDDE